jgi:hypothetical protein
MKSYFSSSRMTLVAILLATGAITGLAKWTSTASPSVAFVECPTQSMSMLSPIRLPSAVVTTAEDVHQIGTLHLYGTQANGGLLAAPAGWTCAAALASDGITIRVFPRSEHWGFEEAGLHHVVGSGVSVHFGGGCVSCFFAQTCPYFTAARNQYNSDYSLQGDLSTTSPLAPGHFCAHPSDEEVTTITPKEVVFRDPPHVAGTGVGSGGSAWSIGQVFLLGSDDYAVVSCTLPSTMQATCQRVLGWFDGSRQTVSVATIRHGRVVYPAR